MTRLLLVNPLIHDFAAYDFWALPLGLLNVAGWLEHGLARARDTFRLQLLDCLDPGSPWLPISLRPKRRDSGRGKLARTPVPKPPALPFINRRYSRYGLPPDAIRRALADHEQPDLVLVTSTMSYWYPGVAETIALIKERWPEVQVVLGGLYATLCPDHAQAHSGADWVAPGPLTRSAGVVLRALGIEPLDQVPWDPETCLPAHGRLAGRRAAALLTSWGCPLACPYCGVRTLHPTLTQLSPERVEREVRLIAQELGIEEIALYDDAFTADAERAVEILERIEGLHLHLRLRAPVQLHAASGLSCRGITLEVARAMRRAGFATIRLGLETADPEQQRQLGGKVTNAEFCAAMESLAAAGYDRREIGVYVMVGLPGQRRYQVEQSLDLVLDQGARPHLAEYSPIPHSPIFPAARAASSLDLDEPLFHNPTLLPCAGPDLDHQALSQIKEQLRLRL
jgi:radical SAM superfamily enzyme YgiQ (UPF0313 family)